MTGDHIQLVWGIAYLIICCFMGTPG